MNDDVHILYQTIIISGSLGYKIQSNLIDKHFDYPVPISIIRLSSILPIFRY